MWLMRKVEKVEEEREVEGLSKAEEWEDRHSTRLRLNASNATSLETFNMIVLCGEESKLC